MKKRNIYLVTVIGIAAVIGIGTVVWTMKNQTKNANEAVYKEVTVEKGNLTVGVTESGSVTIGTLEQTFELESSDSTGSASSAQSNAQGQTSAVSAQGSSTTGSSVNSLEIEEVYVSVGQQVALGDPIIRLTEESVSDYREALEEEVEDASASVSSASLASEKQKLEAGYSYNLSVAEGTVAEANYQASLQELQDAVDKAQQAVNDSASLIAYYEEQIAAGVDLSASLAEEQNNYAKLCTKLTAAQNNYTTKSIEAEAGYQSAMLSSQNAGSQYSVDVSGADNEVKNAKKTLADAKEALEEFDTCIGDDNIIYAEYAGTIMEIAYEAGDTLSSGSTIATFFDASAVTMTVSVSEEDISDISVGDVVDIALKAYEDKTYSGEVIGMDISASSGSSTVSYDVTAAFTGDISGVYMDMTGNVTFIENKVEDVLYVSNKAIINEDTVSYVKVKDASGSIRKVEVETGFSDGVNIEIISGLDEGEVVLIEGKVKTE